MWDNKHISSITEDIANNTTRNLENTGKKHNILEKQNTFNLTLYFLLSALFSDLNSLFLGINHCYTV
jgi:hypothetical protein